MTKSKRRMNQLVREKKLIQQLSLELCELTNEEIQKLMRKSFSKMTSRQLYMLYETKLGKEITKRLSQIDKLLSS